MVDPFEAAMWGFMLLPFVACCLLACLIKFVVAIIKFLYKIFKH